MSRFTKTSLLLLTDGILITGSFLLSALLTHVSWQTLPARDVLVLILLLFLELGVFLQFGLYRAVLRHASVGFLLTVLKASFVGGLVVILGLYLAKIRIGPELLFIDWLLTIALLGGSRFFIRCCFEFWRGRQKGRRILIYGAGDMGAIALRQLKMDRTLVYQPVGFIDDDAKKQGENVQGLKVVGTVDHLERLIEELRVEEMVVAIAQIAGDKLRDLVKRCRQKRIVCRILPSFPRVLEMEPKMRSVELADLMRRPPHHLDKEAIRNYLGGKCVLVTGGAGSIGSELVRQSLRHSPKKVVVVDQSEYGLYSLQEELGEQDIQYCICDITDLDQTKRIFEQERPDIVFHAAAYKHVPLLEDNPIAAIQNNIGGTLVVARFAHQYGVKNFVLISTDKAVKPSGVMGATKRVCELFVQNFNRFSKTEFVSVRFGNVLGSSGSVVPKFLEQIRQGKPVTVTHPEANRYFMLIDEAVQLVLQAAAIGQGGEVFILNMGKPISILEVAEDLIYLMGKQPHGDIPIIYTGLRPGEKLHEELFHDEIEERTPFEAITVGRAVLLDWPRLEERVDQLLGGLSVEPLDVTMKRLQTLASEETFHQATLKWGKHAELYG